MSKFSQGDIAVVTDHGREGIIVRIENWRGGRVAPYVVRILKSHSPNYKVGDISYFSGRDMELKEMQGKKKVYCCHQGCSTYSFEDKGTLQWECFKHYPNKFNPDFEEVCSEEPSIEQKLDLILEHLDLEIVIEPKKVTLKKKGIDTNG